LDRRISDLAGAVELTDPFLAVALQSDVPDAFDYSQWDFGPNTGLCPDPGVFTPGTSVFFYPIVMPDFIAAQANLISDPVFDLSAAGDLLPDPETMGPESCQYDRDQDDVADALESLPASLGEQIFLRQLKHLQQDPAYYGTAWGQLAEPVDATQPFWDASFIDVDSNEEPDDQVAASAPQYNIGGRSALEGEEAMWMGWLPAGQYIILVGGVESTGSYDLSVRVLVE